MIANKNTFDDGDSCKVNHIQGKLLIKESYMRKPQFQGLMERKYYDLSVLECLNALVDLISVAKDNNTILIVLEEPQEITNVI